MTVGSIIGGGMRLVRTQPQVVAIWAALYLVAMVAGVVAMRPWMAEMIAFQQQAAAAAAAGVTTPPAFPAAWLGTLFLVDLAFLVGLVVAFAAVVRAVAWPTGDRFAYLRLGMDELRLIGLFFIVAIAVIVAEIVAIVVVALIGMAFALVAGQGTMAVITTILVIALLCGLIYVEVRLSLAGALTVIRGRIVIREAWRATRGQFWRLLGVYVLLTVAFTIVMIVIVAVTNPHLILAYASLDPRAITAAAQEQMARQAGGLSPGLVVQSVVSAILGTVMGAIACGAVATAALELDAQPRE